MKPSRGWLLMLSLALVGGCATSKPVNMDEPRRVVGTENNVRIDAEVFSEKLSANMSISLKYDITNLRPDTILVADLIPLATYDSDTQMVTVDIGTEIPGQELLPRLIPIGPGEKKSFSTAARVRILIPQGTASPFVRYPNALRLKVNFLGDTKPFEELIAIPEKAVRNPQLADAIFPQWLERNETVVTNALPMRWDANAGTGMPPIDASAPAGTGTRRRGRRG